jgi:aspartyl-tRNA(Asn)/glutamyl-tRNA(Gln) amidotransferase subunit C
MADKITRDEIRHVARLARLELNEAEERQITEQLNAILGYMEKLNQLDTTDIAPMTHAIILHNVFREDGERVSLARDAALANAPASDGVSFIVPKVI